MIPLLTQALVGYSLVLTIVTLVLALRNRAAGRWTLIGTAAMLLLLLAQAVVSIVLWGQSPDTDGVLFFGYLLTAIVVVPLAGGWAYAELSRWGPAVLAVAGVTVAVMIVRMDQIWI
ncbi:hypothetical protein [Brevibacterium album]|uniref:hypothetical protein n=1 Tax=Brevibacterium album TaxID=417948 RepID=UPI00048ED651|nr:hypothetical protein [Brevibacterium album]